MKSMALSNLSFWRMISHLPSSEIFVVGWTDTAPHKDEMAPINGCFCPLSSDISVWAASRGSPMRGIIRRLAVKDACPFRTLDMSAGELFLDGAKNP